MLEETLEISWCRNDRYLYILAAALHLSLQTLLINASSLPCRFGILSNSSGSQLQAVGSGLWGVISAQEIKARVCDNLSSCTFLTGMGYAKPLYPKLLEMMRESKCCLPFSSWLLTIFLKIVINFKKPHLWNWRDDLTVKSTDWSSQDSGLRLILSTCTVPNNCLWLPYGPWSPRLVLSGTAWMCTYIYWQNTHTH